MRWLKVLVFSVFVFNTQAYKSYHGFKTFRVYPEYEDHAYLLELLRKSGDFDFWTDKSTVGKPVDIMVTPKKLEFFVNFLEDNHFNASILVKNVGKTVKAKFDLATRRMDDGPPGTISFERFERYDTIEDYLQNLAQKYSYCTVFNMGRTYEGRDHVGIKISSGGANKPVIVVDGGIHAREWLAPAQVLYIIHQLAENPANKDYFALVDWYLIPVLNPDGYEYTHTDDRFWRKTLAKYKKCRGADPNRNFGFHWNEVGASADECDVTYAGPKAFSEIETKNFRDFVSKITNIQMYLTFHSYGNLMLYPWGWTKSYPKNRKELHSLAKAANDAIQAVRGSTYQIGSSTNVLYPAAGGSDDWMMGVRGVPITYTIELPGGGSQGFDPPESDILPAVEEMWEGVKVFAKYVMLKTAYGFTK